MRNIVGLLALQVAVLATATVARADTLSTSATAEAPASEPNIYVEAGVMAGANGGSITGAYSAQAGYQLPSSPIWLHAMVVDGNASQLLTSGNGTFTQARVGAEAKTCIADGIVCSLFGLDIGYQHVGYSGQTATFDGGDGQMVASDDAGLVVVPRYTLDIGSKYVRVRPGIELPLSADGLGIDLTLAVAVKF
jgi:hypothetical protein